MKKNIVRNWGYIGPADEYGDLHITEGQCFAGFVAGILVPYDKTEKKIGNLANARTFSFPVRYAVVNSISDPNAVYQTVAAEIAEKARQLEAEGCRFITSAGGAFGKYQKIAAAAVDLPVYMTALLQLKWIKIGLKSSENILVLSDLSKEEAIKVFENCGISENIYGNCVFVQTDPLAMDPEEVLRYLKDEVIPQNAVKVVLLDTELFAGLRESVKSYLKLNVWDIKKLMGYVACAVCQRQRTGFI
ncbi:MAG: hypothetical protein IKZ47_00670 [Clostridia bacterium]|nr:hypothetical protein [Clostridia bacterium]